MIENDKTIIEYTNKLYGRTDQFEQIIDFYNTTLTTDASLTLISGVSGMGKTSFVNGFVESLQDENVCFVKGKQDFSRNNPPYSSIIQAFSQLISNWVKDENNSNKAEIQTVLKRELGVHNKILLKAFPQLSELLNDSADLEVDFRLTFKDRFNEALLSFLNALKFLKQRTIVFLDDLQWADESVIEFFKLWLSEGKANNVFFIGAFRIDEVKTNGWLFNQTKVNKQKIKNVNAIKLEGLSLDIIREMTSDILTMREGRQTEFSELVLQLTGGNPLFVRESLPYLLDDNVLFYDEETQKWDYDSSSIKSFDKSSRTLDFIIRKMEILSDETRELLCIGAAIGNTFNLTVLSAVSEISKEKIKELLKPCIERRIVEKKDTESKATLQYHFVHDKMQSASYALLSRDRQEKIHYLLGKTYSSSLGYAAKDRHVYDIVNQFNECISYFETEQELLSLVELNLVAGKKAKRSSSFDIAVKYFNIVINIIESNKQDWGNSIVFEVYLESGESAYLKSDFVSSVMYYESALKYATTNLQKAKVHHNFLVMYNGVSDLDAAWKSGLDALKLLGIKFPSNVGKGKVLSQFLKIKLLLKNVDSTNLLELPKMENPEAEQILLSLMELIPAAWGKKPEMLGYLVLKGFEILLKNGNSPVGYFAVSGYGAILGMAFGKIEKGWEYVKTGGQLTEKYDSMIFHGRGNFGVYGTYSHLLIHSKNNIQPLLDAFQFSKGAGDYAIASHSSIILLENMFAIGMPLDEIKEKARSFFNFMKRTANYDYLSSHKAIVVATKILQKGYDSSSHHIEKTKDRMNRVNFPHIRYTWNIYHLFTTILFNKYEEAKNIVSKIENDAYSALSSIELVRVICLSIVKADEALHGGSKQKALKFLKSIKKEVAKYERINPDNYAQILSLCNALIYEINANTEKAIKAYKAAIFAAEKYEFINNNALFSERLANIYIQNKRFIEAAEFLRSAQNNYEIWGAAHKALLIEKTLEKAPFV